MAGMLIWSVGPTRPRHELFCPPVQTATGRIERHGVFGLGRPTPTGEVRFHDGIGVRSVREASLVRHEYQLLPSPDQAAVESEHPARQSPRQRLTPAPSRL